ncbi:MAG: response regulator, partial [Bacteroidales bacterium]|nr:response regulator [Bacteroidales bacterium]
CEKNNIELNIYKEIDENDFAIISDPFRVKQILKNLLSNALKYTEEGSIEFGYHIKTSNDEFFMEFFVKDTGIGMEKNQAGFIFERFKKIEDNKEKLYRGAGLGLTITQNLVQLLGGKIWVDSTKDKGSTFFFTLPYKIAEPSLIKLTDKEEITKDYNWKDKIILIAEDDFSNYLVIKHLLIKTQVQLLWAKNGKHAVETCKNNSNIGLILMDVKMPEMNGYEATGLIKQFRKKLPIIAITAYALLGDREKSLKAGCDDYLSKPIEQEKLLLLIDKYLT